MPARTGREYAETSYSSVPPGLIDGARALARRRKVYVRDVYTDAFLKFIDHVDAGGKVEWAKLPPIDRENPQRGYHVRLEVEVLDTIRQACERHQVKGNVLFITALRDLLRSEGVEVDT